jgi:hypothetical protein
MWQSEKFNQDGKQRYFKAETGFLAKVGAEHSEKA